MLAGMLPARLRLAPHHTLLPHGSASRRIGLDPGTGLVAEDLSPPLALMLDELSTPVLADALLGRVDARYGDRAHAADLLDGLLASGAVVDVRDGERVHARRRCATVLVDGDGPVAAGVVTGLVLAGVGTVHVTARGTVTSRDVGSGYLDADRGTDRMLALVDAGRRAVPHADVGPQAERVPADLAVLCDAVRPAPALVERLHRDTVAYLPVHLRDGVGVVGPLVLPGRTPCLTCADRHRDDEDPGWLGAVAQLVGRTGAGDPATVAATAALGTAQALALLDGTAAPAALGTVLEVDVQEATTTRSAVVTHPECRCGAPHP